MNYLRLGTYQHLKNMPTKEQYKKWKMELDRLSRKYEKSKPPKTEEERKEWDKKRKEILKAIVPSDIEVLMTPGIRILPVDEKGWICECLECGYLLRTSRHCRDIKCPVCGGEMRRLDRPGPGNIEKAEDPYMTYPDESKAYRYVIQMHFRGRSSHLDLRMEHNDYLIGWTIMDLIKGAIKEPVETLEQARKIWKKISKIDWDKGVPKLRPGIKPGYKEKYAELSAARKAPEPRVWMNVEGVVPKGEVGATKQYPGVFLIVDRGIVEYGAQKPYFHEYFLSKGKLKGRWVFRQLRPKEFKGKVELKEIIPPSRETKYREEAAWFLMKPVDETPYVLSDSAIEKKWIPPAGVSALPKSIRTQVPKEFQYWKEKDKAKRIEIRNKLVKEGILKLKKRENLGTVWARAAYHYVLSQQQMTIWRTLPKEEKFGRVLDALIEFEKIYPLKKAWIQDAIVWLEKRPNEMKSLMVEALLLRKSRKVRFSLQWHWWRGQRVVRAGPTTQHWDLRLDLPANSGKMHFVLTQNPLKNKEVSAIWKPCKYEGWMDFEGYLPPRNERKKMSKEELKKFPKGLEEANPTKNTPAYLKILDKGEAIVYEDGQLFKKFEFKGKKLKGLWTFEREDTSKFWVMRKSKLPKVE